MQDTAANCGPASVSNALQALGVIRSQQECEQLCKTSATDGTTGRNMVKALTSLGFSPAVIREKREDVAALRLRMALHQGRPLVLCVDNWEHWVAAVGVLGERILVADPADNELVLSYDVGALLRRWGGDAAPYYGVIL